MKNHSSFHFPRFFQWLLVVLLLLDLIFSGIQHFHTALDGDFAKIVLPVEWYQKILGDPFGWNAVFHGEKYAGTNRFFVHFFMSNYFKTVPIWLQNWVNPLDSLYLSCAVLKLFIQLSLIGLLSFFVKNTVDLGKNSFLLSALILSCLFQTKGYNGLMGIIDESITYTCFYALPIVFLLIFLIPFFNFIDLKLNKLTQFLWLILAIILPFSGPLIAPLAIIVFGFLLFKNKVFLSDLVNFKSDLSIIHGAFLLLILLSFYSLFLGTFNIENSSNPPSLWTRYSLLPKGLFEMFTLRIGSALLLIFLLINTFLIKKLSPTIQQKRLLEILKWITIFSVIYTLLLPLAGFRDYRPNIVRRDTMLPVWIGFFYFFTVSTVFLLKNLSEKIYLISIVALLLLFTIADEPGFKDYYCERQALETIINSKETLVFIENDCTILSWQKITDAGASKENAQLLVQLGILKSEKLYFQK